MGDCPWCQTGCAPGGSPASGSCPGAGGSFPALPPRSAGAPGSCGSSNPPFRRAAAGWFVAASATPRSSGDARFGFPPRPFCQNVLVWPVFQRGAGHGQSGADACPERPGCRAGAPTGWGRCLPFRGSGLCRPDKCSASERARRLPRASRRAAGAPGSRARAGSGLTLPPAGGCQGTGGPAGPRRAANKDEEAKLTGQGDPRGLLEAPVTRG